MAGNSRRGQRPHCQPCAMMVCSWARLSGEPASPRVRMSLAISARAETMAGGSGGKVSGSSAIWPPSLRPGALPAGALLEDPLLALVLLVLAVLLVLLPSALLAGPPLPGLALPEDSLLALPELPFPPLFPAPP